MAYVTPPTFVSGAVLTAAQLNVLGDDIVYLKAQADGVAVQGVYLTRSTGLSLANVTYVDIPWTTENVDVGGWHAAGSTDIVIPAGAIPSGFSSILVRVDAVVTFASNNANSRGIAIVLNGSSIGAQFVQAINGDSTTMNTFAWAVCVAGDVLKVQAWQSSGVTLVASQMKVGAFRLGGV